jgi:hypothetical protein
MARFIFLQAGEGFVNKLTLMLLFGSGVLLGLSNFFSADDLAPVYIAALILVMAPIVIVFETARRKSEDEVKARDLFREAQRITRARKEVRSRIPKNSPRRESPAAFEGYTKVGAVRSMASLIRKPRLRQIIMEISDFADMVLETICRMPNDTPAAVYFSETHLSRLIEALERCFEMSRNEDYKSAPSSIDAQEIECFNTFITAFKKQQESILFEGHCGKKA